MKEGFVADLLYFLIAALFLLIIGFMMSCKSSEQAGKYGKKSIEQSCRWQGEPLSTRYFASNK